MSNQEGKVFVADLIDLNKKESELSRAMLDMRARLHSLEHFKAPQKNTIKFNDWPEYNMWSYQRDINNFGATYKNSFTVGFCQHAKDYGDSANVCVVLAESIKEILEPNKDVILEGDKEEVLDFWKEIGDQLDEGKKSCDSLTESILYAQGQIANLVTKANEVKKSHTTIITKLVRDEYSKEIKEGSDPKEIIANKSKALNKSIKKLENKLDDLRKARDWTFAAAGGSTCLIATIPFSPFLAMGGSGISIAIHSYKSDLKDMYKEFDKLGDLVKTSNFINTLEQSINETQKDLKKLSKDLAIVRGSFETINKNFSTSSKLNKILFNKNNKLRVTFVNKMIEKLREIEKTADEYVLIADKMDFVLIDNYADLIGISA